jgi:hypothetical protein
MLTFLRPLVAVGLLTVSPVGRQAVEQRLISCRSGGRLIDNNHVEPHQCGLMLSKRLPDNALDSISARRLPALFLGDRQAETSDVLLVVSAKHRKPFVLASRRFFEHPPERSGIEQPLILLEPVKSAASQHGVFGYGCNNRRFSGVIGYGVSLARPLARRRLRTRRPALVAMRARNPCVRARFILLG